MRALIVEDDHDLAKNLKQSLDDEGYAVDHADNGEDGWHLGDTEPYDVIVLDLGLPEMDGVSVLKKWREADLKTPVLILTARDGWSEKVKGFDAGADDYLTKPFHTQELQARLRALIRRAAGKADGRFIHGDLIVDPKAKTVHVKDELVKLTAHEYKTLHYLVVHSGEVVSRTELTEHIYDQDFDLDSNTIEVFIGRLRKKIGADWIETVRGLGYRFCAQT